MAAAYGEFNVWRVVVLTMNDDEVFHSPGDIELAIAKKAKVARTEKLLGLSLQMGVKNFLCLFLLTPISKCHARARNPNFAYAMGGAQQVTRWIYNENILPTHRFSTRNQHA